MDVSRSIAKLGIAIPLACASILIGNVAQWWYAARGLDLEARLLGVQMPLIDTISMSMLALAAQFSAGVIALHVLARALGGTAKAGDSARAICFASFAALGKLVPWIGWFVALLATLWALVYFVRRAHGISWWRAALASIGAMIPVIALTAAGALLFSDL